MYIMYVGAKASEVMKIRIDNWLKSDYESDRLCKCDSQRALVLHSQQHQMKRITSESDLLSMIQLGAFRCLQHLQQAAGIIPGIQPSLSDHESVRSEYIAESAISQFVDEIEDICRYIDEFIENLFNLMSCDNSKVIAASISLIEQLLEQGFPEIAVPFLVTLLQGQITLLAVYRTKAYKLLIDALNKLETNKQIEAFDKWVLKVICTYISSQEDLSQLPSIQSTLICMLKFLIKQKPAELVLHATESICSKTFSYVFQTMLDLYSSHEDLIPTDSKTQSVINFLEALYSIDEVDKRNEALISMMSAVWLYPDLYDVAAKAITSILPHDFFSLINNKCTLVIAPKGSDVQLYQYEMDIQDKVVSNKISPFDAALKYLDLMIDPRFIHYPHQEAMCLLKSAYYFSVELERTNQQPMQYALRNAVSMLAYDASQLAARLHPGMRVCILASSYRLTCSVAKLSDPSNHCCLSGRVACSLLKNLLHNSQFTYLLSHPMSLHDIWVSASNDINQISDLAQQAYIKHLLSSEHSLPSKQSLLQYQCFENHFCKQPWNMELNNERVKTMYELLKGTKWTFDDVSKAMKTPLLQRNSEGYIQQHDSLGDYLEIAELKGVSFDYNETSPSIHVIIKPAKDGNGILSYKDIIEILQLTSGETEVISFSLDPASGQEHYHPFMRLRCHPKKLQNTEFMQSLFHADYLLKFLTTGVEVSAEPPFDFKAIEESLTKNLPDNLKLICRPPFLRGTSYMKSHRFWIEAEEIFYDEHIHESTVSYYIGDVKLSVKSRPLITALNGNSFDAKHSMDGPQADFAKDLTKHYGELSKCFPIFARVKELCKLQFMCQKLHSKLQSLKRTNSELFASFSAEINRLHSLYPIKECPDSCTWVPATYNNRVYGGVLFKPASSHLEHFSKQGYDYPTDIPAHPAFPVVHDTLLQDANPALHAAGGIRANFQDQHKINLSQFGPDVMCVRLGQAANDSNQALKSHSEDTEDHTTHANYSMCDNNLSPQSIPVGHNETIQSTRDTSEISASKGTDHSMDLSTDKSEEFIQISENASEAAVRLTTLEGTSDVEISSTTLDEVKLLPPSGSSLSDSYIKPEGVLLISETDPAPTNTKEFPTKHDTTIAKDQVHNSSDADQYSVVNTNTVSLASTNGIEQYQQGALNVKSEETDMNATLENPNQPQSPKNVTSRLQPTYPIESNIDLVMAKAAKHQIVLLGSHAPRDTLTTAFGQTLINQALFGEVLAHPHLKHTLETKYDFNETDFHPNVLARQQIKTALVLRKIIELHYKQHNEDVIILQ